MRASSKLLAVFMSVVLAAGLMPSLALAEDLAAVDSSGLQVATQDSKPVLKDGKAQAISFKGSIESFDFTISVKANSLVRITNSFNANADTVLAMLQDANGDSLGIWHPLSDKRVGAFALRPGTYNLNYLVGAANASRTTSGTVGYAIFGEDYGLGKSTVEKFFSSDKVSTYLNSDLSKISTPLKLGKQFVGTLCAPPTGTDIDHYSFTVKDPGPYSMLLRGWSKEVRLVWLCDKKGNMLKNKQTKASCVSTTSAGVAMIDFGKLKKGTYYVAVGPQSTASYTAADPYGGYVYKDIFKAKVTGIKNKRYTGKKVTQNIKVTWNGTTLKKGRDYGVYYSDNKKVGTATVNIYPKGEFAGSPMTIMKTFKIKK